LTAELPERIWVRVGGGLELVPGGDRHGPADLDHPPPGDIWTPLEVGDRLVGWAARDVGANGELAARAIQEGDRLAVELRAQLLGRLGHKLRSGVLALQETARQAAFGRVESMDEIYEQAVEVGRRAGALEVAALDSKDQPRSVVIGAVLNLAAPFAERRISPEALVRGREPVLVEALSRAYEWMGGPGCVIVGEPAGRWWRLEFTASPEPAAIGLPEAGEPLVRLLIDTQLEGWLDASGSDRAVIYLPAA
jgi:hypothetical protein